MDNNYRTDNPEQDQGNSKPNVSMARHFLTTLSSSVDDDIFTFQIIPESPTCTHGAYPEIIHGTFDQVVDQLLAKNIQGYGIFVAINRTDGQGRKRENVLEIRAVFVDLDGSPLEPVINAALEPHLFVETSPGRFHVYWMVKNLTLDEFSEIQKALAARFRGDPQVHDLGRVMRVAGFHHHKKSPYLTKIIYESSQQSYQRDDFFMAFEIYLDTQSSPDAHSTRNNPVLEALQKHKLLIRQAPSVPGAWLIKCPWGNLHSNQDSTATYFEPSPEYPRGGFNCFHAHCALRTLNTLLEFLGLDDIIIPIKPLPLHRPLEAPQPFPLDALGDILGSAAKALQRVIQAPDAVCAQSVLGAAALLCQSFANVIVDGREIPLVIFLITIAESGDRKSSTDKTALTPIYEWQKYLNEKYRAEYEIYPRDLSHWEAKKREWSKDPTKGKYTERPPQAPLEPIILVEEPTYEGVVKYLAIGQPSIGIFSDEGGRFLGGNAMSKENLLKTIAGLSSLWDGKSITRVRAGDGSVILYGRRVSLHLMVQEVILEQLMENPLINRQGFLPRCLISYPSTTAGTRRYVADNLADDPAMIRYWERQQSLLKKKPPVNAPPAPQNELQPYLLPLSEKAKETWVAFHDRNELELGPGKKYEPIRRFASKAAEHVLRLAGVMALFDNPDAMEIDEVYILRGIELVQYYLEETLRIQGYLTVHPDLTLAQKVLKWCWEKGKVTISLSDLYQNGPVEIRQAKKARSIMLILEEHGWATPTPDVEIEGTKHKEAWRIRPEEEE